MKKLEDYKLKKLDINKIVVSNKLPFVKEDCKYFIGYKGPTKNKTFMLIPSGNVYIYRRDFDETKCMYFLIKEVKVFDKYNEIWGKVSNMIKKE